MADLTGLEENLGVRFKDRSKLLAALIHSSYVNEKPGYDSNERLEFLGDAVIGLVVAETLYEALPQAAEGELTQKRAALVSRASLARIAQKIELGDYLLLGRGEEATSGRMKLANLAGAIEAVIAAVYLEMGIEVARTVILRLMRDEIDRILSTPEETDYKSELQELTQSQGRGTPAYRLAGETGPDHNKIFTVELIVGGSVLAAGSGKSKKIAETEAAKNALKKLGMNFTD